MSLTDVEVRNAKACEKPYRLSDDFSKSSGCGRSIFENSLLDQRCPKLAHDVLSWCDSV